MRQLPAALGSTRAVLAASCALAAAACGGGGSGGTSAPSQDALPPAVAVRFPPPSALVAAAEITVVGTASDPSGVAEVTVAGVPATTSDGFAHWRATVALDPGPNALVVAARDAAGNVAPQAAEIALVCSGPFLTSLLDACVDPAGGRLLVADGVLDALLGIDLDTGERSVLSGAGLGTGPAFANPVAIAVAPSGAEAYVLEGLAGKVLRVDLASGSRTLLSGPGVGSGSTLLYSSGLAFDALQDRLLVAVTGVYAGTQSLVAVDLSSGDRTLVSGLGAGAGPAFAGALDLCLDTAAGLAYVTDGGLDALLAVDLASGDRALVSAPGLGQGPTLVTPEAPELDPLLARVLLVDSGAVAAIDLATGDRTLLSGSGAGSGPEFGAYLAGLALDVAHARLLCGQPDGVLEVDPLTGDRATFAANVHGGGPSLIFPDEIERVAAPGALLLKDFDTQTFPPPLRFLWVDLASGERALVEASLSGPLLFVPQGLAHDAAGARVLFTATTVGPDGYHGALAEIELASGLTTLVEGSASAAGEALPSDLVLADGGATALAVVDDEIRSFPLASGANGYVVVSGPLSGGPTLGGPARLALDAAANRLYATQELYHRVLAIDVDSGERTVLTGGATGSGPALSLPVGIALDAANGRALVADRGLRALVSVELATGNRKVVWSGSMPAGAPPGTVYGHDAPRDVVVDSAAGVAYVAVQGHLNAVLAIEIATGQMAVLSR